ncbi:unnamed protein product [Ilex paraguariensis]|uniref:G3BP-like protein n=1 Tax=Ilex paraguariensis TaxID=185542 RepID=A0ABC8QM29_9AQUA
MASPYRASVSAVQVGRYFVQQYYPVLCQRPHLVHHFYTDDSSMVRVDGNSSKTVSAKLQIHALMMSRKFTRIVVKTINSLESWNGGVVVVVSGTVKSQDFSGLRIFVQTFFLAPQKEGYFVINDIFHFVTEEVMYPPPVSIVSENKVEPQANTSSLLPDTPDFNRALEVGAREFEEETIVEEPSIREPPAITYASIVRAPKGKSVRSVPAQPSFTKNMDVAGKGLSREEEGDLLELSTSVCVKNLPSTIRALDILHEFSNFGRIKPDGVFLRNRKEIGVCFAFVEFESVQSAQNAIKASPLQLAGRRVYVEVRRANGSSSSSRGGREAIKMGMTTANKEAMDSRVRNDPKGHDTPSISNWA